MMQTVVVFISFPAKAGKDVFVKRKSRHLIIKNRGSGVKREKE
jgi:hypothetical protein